MAYRKFGRKRVYRKRRGFKKTRSRASKYRGRKQRSRVSGRSKTIQSSSFLPKSRLIRFTERRTFQVLDNSADGVPPSMYFYANSPVKFYGTASGNTPQGSWKTDRSATDADNIGEFVTPGDGSGNAPYRNGRVIGSSITVTATPNPTIATSDGHQDTTLVFLEKQTAVRDISTAVSAVYNQDSLAAHPNVKHGLMFTNPNGAPKGTSLRATYSAKSVNPNATNTGLSFYQDTVPGEKDWYKITLMPSDLDGYALGSGATVPPTRIVVQVSYVCLLGEPNSKTIQAGTSFPSFPGKRSMTQMAGED